MLAWFAENWVPSTLARSGCRGVTGLESRALYAVKGVGVLGEPLGLVAWVGKNEPVLHGDVGIDLVEAGDDLLATLDDAHAVRADSAMGARAMSSVLTT